MKEREAERENREKDRSPIATMFRTRPPMFIIRSYCRQAKTSATGERHLRNGLELTGSYATASLHATTIASCRLQVTGNWLLINQKKVNRDYREGWLGVVHATACPRGMGCNRGLVPQDLVAPSSHIPTSETYDLPCW